MAAKKPSWNRPLVVGGGLAGCEAAWCLAEAGIAVDLVEMRPGRTTPVHTTDYLAELVCSNSLRGDAPTNAVGLLKREMEALDSLVIRTARAAAVPAGGALAVDRWVFSRVVTEKISAHPKITLHRHEVVDIDERPTIIATGPLTSAPLHDALEKVLGEGALAFFDALAPVLAADSLDLDVLFRESRYDKGGGADYLNCALDKQTYEDFIDELLAAETVPFRDFEEKTPYFEGCLPIEVMAERGRDTLRFGPMKPVGLTNPSTGRRPWAVLQLRQDDLAAEHWNMVGFQTKLKQAEQRRVFQSLPGLENARFVRYGMIHRNTFIRAPAHLDAGLRVVSRPNLWLAGQLTGVEGYVESAATGMLAARSVIAALTGRELRPIPEETAMGGLVRHLTLRSAEDFQPSNITWGLIVCPQDLRPIRSRRERRQQQALRAEQAIRQWAGQSSSV